MKKLDDIKDWLDIFEHQKIGEILMQSNKITLNDLGIALDIQKFEKSMPDLPLGKILLEMKVITKEELQTALALQDKIDKLLERKKGRR